VPPLDEIITIEPVPTSPKLPFKSATVHDATDGVRLNVMMAPLAVAPDRCTRSISLPP
jgi:hypothetical protein